MTILLGETQPVARTSHRCNLCNRVIHPGETYLRQRCIDGDPYVFKGCGHCLAAQAILDRVDPKVSALPGYVEFEFGGLYGHRLTVPQAVAELMLVHLRLLHQRPTEAGVA